jgi:SAM-dependent methyltransferase
MSKASDKHLAARDLFDRTADQYQQRSGTRIYDLTSFAFARRKAIVLEFLDSSPRSGSLLDYGMGPGVFAQDVVSRGLRFIGIDLSPEMIERARALGLENCEYVAGDLDSLHAYREAVDVVLAIGLIDYLDDPEAGLEKLITTLKPGGTLILSFRNRRSLVTLLRDFSKRVWRAFFGNSGRRSDTAFASPVHEKSFSFRSDLEPTLSRLNMSGFKVRYFRFSPVFVNVPIPKPLWLFWYPIDKALAGRWTRWLCSGGVLSCRKRE